ncbi:hypothetical protein Tco_1567697, partial [Tanacetum coccineum]
PIPTPTNTEATTSTIAVPESETFSAIHQRITDLEKDVKELKSVDNSTTVISAIKFEVSNAIKSILNQVWTMLCISLKHRALYHALMESILKDEDAMDKGVSNELKKRKPDDTDKDEGPSAGSNQGLKRQRTSKGTETLKKTSTTKDSSKGKYPATSSKSSKFGKSTKDRVIEPISMQDSNNAEHDDAECDYADMLMDQGEYLGNTDEQPNDEVVPKNNWYKKSNSDTSLDLEWNEGKLVDDRP